MGKLKNHLLANRVEAGCDEAGRGCLAGPVVAAAIVLPPRWFHPDLDDSKKLNAKKRKAVRDAIEADIEHKAVGWCTPEEIDEINILKASFVAMHRALDKLKMTPDCILVDGNRFLPYRKISHECIVKGDGIFTSIAAASVLAKTYRDDIMARLHEEFPEYGWSSNKGYPTKEHRSAIAENGPSPYHRKSFTLLPDQLVLF